MKETLAYIRGRIVGGLFLLLPVTLLFILVGKLWRAIKEFVMRAVEVLGIERMVGVATLVILTIFVILLMAFVAGLIVHLNAVSSFNSWLERNILRFIPGYAYIRLMLQDRFSSQHGQNCLLVWIDDTWQPALLIEENETHCVIFLPGSPEPSSGSTSIIEKERIRHIDMTARQLNETLNRFGEGMLALFAKNNIQTPQ